MAIQYQQSLARYNDQASTAASVWQQNLLNQQSATAAGLLALTASITGTNQVLAAAAATGKP